MKYNYHTHCQRCGHATGTEEDMIKRAIALDMKVIGFSDHVPFPFSYEYLCHVRNKHGAEVMIKHFYDQFYHQYRRIRMPFYEQKKYLETLKYLKEKYEDQIQVLIGFECEYFKEYIPYYQSMLTEGLVDYLILGNHFNETMVFEDYCGYRQDSEMIINYYDDAISAFKTGLFKYFAHPDLFMRSIQNWDSVCEKATHQLCQAGLEYGVVFEINCGGIQSGLKQFEDGERYGYPDDRFWKIVSQYKIPTIIGLDAHAPEELNEEIYQVAKKFAEDLGIEVIEGISVEQLINGYY